MSAKSKLVILGGGVAGVMIARQLSPLFDVTLVDPKDHMEIRFGIHRAAVEPEVGQKLLTTYRYLLPDATFVMGKPKAVELAKDGHQGCVRMEDGKELRFDFLVISTGGQWTDPFIAGDHVTKAERLVNMKETKEKIGQANSITIIGGGVVGVEVAGEIASDFPGKKIKVVHSRGCLVSDDEPKLGAACQKVLEKLGVTVLLNQRAEFGADGKPKSTKPSISSAGGTGGEDISADLSFVCTGLKPSTKFLVGGELASALNAAGQILVNERFQVLKDGVALDNVFSLGDCSALPGLKCGRNSREQALVLVDYLRSVVKGKRAPAPWKMTDGPLIIAIGRGDGAMRSETPDASVGQIPRVACGE